MAKIQNISEIHPTLGFTEFDVLEKYRKSFNESELGRLHSVFPFDRMAKAAGLSEQRLGRRNIFSPAAKIALMVLKAYTGFSDRQLVEHLNGNIHYQIFCGIMIDPSFPITNYKIVSAIRNEMASRLDIESLQEVLASHWKPYLENLHVCMTDATCYESHLRFPNRYETPLGKPRMALQAYLQALLGTRHKTSPQQIQECGGVLSFLLQEKKKEGFKNTDAQASYDQTS